MNTKNSQYQRNGEVIQHILIDSSDNVFVGGYFDSIGVTIAKNIAVWDGSEWNRFDSNSENDIDGHIYDMAIRDGTLAIAGYFLMAGGKTSSNIAFCQLGSTAPVKKQYSCKNNSGIYFDKSKNALRLTLMSATKVMTSIFTLSGKLISSVSQTLLPGDHLIMADADRIPSGTYIMQVKMQDRSFQFKINRCR